MEYKILEGVGGAVTVQTSLNSLALDGWRVVSSYTVATLPWVYVILERDPNLDQ